LVNENHKLDQIITHNPSSQNHIISSNWRYEIRNQMKRNFDPINHHKIPKHDYLINEMEIMRFLSPNSSQTFQSFKISLIILQQSFKIRMALFSCNISCCFTLQTWKENGTTGNWSHEFISQEWISSSFHQHLYILNLIKSWCCHKRSPSNLKLKSNLTIDNKIWDGR